MSASSCNPDATWSRVENAANDARKEIERAQKVVDEAIERGATVVLSGAGLVHTFECPSIRQSIDIRSRYEGWEPEELMIEFRYGGGVHIPHLRTTDQVDGRYKVCKICKPNVVPKPKYVGPSTAASNLGSKHIGRRIDGQQVCAINLSVDKIAIQFEDGVVGTFSSSDRIVFDAGRHSVSLSNELATQHV
ncbi:hypothetical protein [Rhodococcus erythropolis]|uniref:hypothetical protein n=1 Tax=Rhodococcus erythropolis TaxID=1833 RepID=UPI003672DFB3